MKIGIVGLGYVGIQLAVGFGQKHSVTGFDLDQHKVDSYKTGEDLTGEVTTQQLVNATSLTFTTDSGDLSGCDLFIIAVPTPVDDARRLPVADRAGADVGRADRQEHGPVHLAHADDVEGDGIELPDRRFTPRGAAEQAGRPVLVDVDLAVARPIDVVGAADTGVGHRLEVDKIVGDWIVVNHDGQVSRFGKTAEEVKRLPGILVIDHAG